MGPRQFRLYTLVFLLHGPGYYLRRHRQRSGLALSLLLDVEEIDAVAEVKVDEIEVFEGDEKLEVPFVCHYLILLLRYSVVVFPRWHRPRSDSMAKIRLVYGSL